MLLDMRIRAFRPLFQLFASLLIVNRCAGISSPCSSNAPAFVAVEDFVKTEFDFLVVGGGLAGVVLSSRLSEDPSVTVGLIEAGTTHFNDIIVDAPANSPAGNSTYDWLFTSIPQAHANGRQILLPRGKMLGGSSATNGLAWGRGAAPEYDSWNTFAPNQGWTWQGLLPWMKKAESYSLEPVNPYPGISPWDAAETAAELAAVQGFGGPLVASYDSFYLRTVPALVKTLNSLGILTNPQPHAGNSSGVSNTLQSVDRRRGAARSYSATTYFCSHSQNRNYRVLLNAQASKINFEQSPSGLTTSGVDFAVNGTTYTARASREVIVSAGADKTPQILELSGIGNRTILSSHGIPTLVDLPGVGENWQDQLAVTVQFQLKPGTETFDILRNNATFAAQQAAQYAASHTGLLASTDNTVAFIPLSQIVTADRLDHLVQLFDQAVPVSKNKTVAGSQAFFLRKWLQDGSVPAIEYIGWSRGTVNPSPDTNYVTLVSILAHPLSRGSVHINTTDPLDNPRIDPNFLGNSFDIQATLDIVKFAASLGMTGPFGELVAKQTDPDPKMPDDDSLIEYIRNNCAGAAHHVGTAAMAPQEIGGVVDGELKVYGTTNLRVVDASIFPNQLAAHPQATVYAIAEKAANIIRMAWKDMKASM